MSTTTRLDQLQFSYAEVLDATKHQDDKVGRFLEAIAFLTAGALVLFDSTFDVGRPLQLGAEPARYPIELWLVLAFLVLALGAASFLLMSLGPQVAPVSPVRGGGEPRRTAASAHETATANERSRSLVFYGAIASRDRTTWREEWAHTPESTKSQIEHSLIDEIYSLAVRVETKHNHSLRARSLFSTAIACLVIALLTVVRGIGTPATVPPRNWSTMFTLALAGAFSGLTALSAYDQFSVANDRQALRDGASARRGLTRPAWRIVLPTFLAGVSATTIRFRPGWLLATGIVATLLWGASILGPLVRATGRRRLRALDVLATGATIVTMLAVSLPMTFRSLDNVWRFADAFVPIAVLETWRFWTPELRALKRRGSAGRMPEVARGGHLRDADTTAKSR